MAHKANYNDLVDLLSTIKPYINCFILHIKSGNEYIVRGAHIRESDMSLEFTYVDVNYRELIFARPAHELLDGRYMIGSRGEFDIKPIKV